MTRTLGSVRGAAGNGGPYRDLASAHFRDAVADVLARPLPLVATVHAFGHPFTDAVKRDPSVTVIRVTRGNRDALPPELAARVHSWAR